MRKQIRHPQPALAVLGEVPIVLADQADLPEEDVGPFAAAEFLAVVLGEVRLVVERVDVAEAAAEADVDRPFGFCCVMRRRICGFAGDFGATILRGLAILTGG